MRTILFALWTTFVLTAEIPAVADVSLDVPDGQSAYATRMIQTLSTSRSSKRQLPPREYKDAPPLPRLSVTTRPIAANLAADPTDPFADNAPGILGQVVLENVAPPAADDYELSPADPFANEDCAFGSGVATDDDAGFGDFGMFAETDWNKEAQMIHLNITTLTQFTKLYLRDMLARGSGKIMNVASTAAFQSGPLMAVYFATKAYVLSFSEAVDNEVRDKGITITTLCPGGTESGFQAAASNEASGLVKGKKLPSAKEVAEYGYNAMLKGETIAIHGWMNYIMANIIRFSPRSLVVHLTRKLQDKVD